WSLLRRRLGSRRRRTHSDNCPARSGGRGRREHATQRDSSPSQPWSYGGRAPAGPQPPSRILYIFRHRFSPVCTSFRVHEGHPSSRLGEVMKRFLVLAALLALAAPAAFA